MIRPDEQQLEIFRLRSSNRALVALLDSIKRTLPHIGGNERSVDSMCRDIAEAITKTATGEAE